MANRLTLKLKVSCLLKRSQVIQLYFTVNVDATPPTNRLRSVLAELCISAYHKTINYWDTVADRLFKISHCMNIEGVVRQLPLFDPSIDPGMLVKAVAAGLDIGSIINNINQPLSTVRGLLLLQKALEICAEVKSLGSALLSALEKKDAEHISLMHQLHEINISKLVQDVNALRAVERARDIVSGGGNSNTTGQPAITAPASINRNDPAPTFQVQLGGRRLYAVEVASRADLFDNASNGSARNEDNFYASWQEAMLDRTPFTLSAAAWDQLKQSSQLFYRMHVADDNSWGNYAVTTADADFGNAPSFQVTTAGGGGTTDNSTGQPSITAPADINRNDPAPTFQVQLGGRRLYAVEVASRADLFDNASNGSARNGDNFYASWQEAMLDRTPFTLSAAAWDRLKQSDQLFYRMHVADDNSWGNYAVTTADAEFGNAPSFQILTDSRTINKKDKQSPKGEVRKIPQFDLLTTKKADEALWRR